MPQCTWPKRPCRKRAKIWSQPTASWWRHSPWARWTGFRFQPTAGFATLCALCNLSVPQCPHWQSREDKKDMLLVRNKADSHKEFSISLACQYTKCSIRALIINDSWGRESLTRTQQKPSKKLSNLFLGQLQYWKGVASAGHSPKRQGALESLVGGCKTAQGKAWNLGAIGRNSQSEDEN